MAALIAAAKAIKKGVTSREFNDSNTEIISCPFDLDEIFKADTDRFAQLREVIKFIFEQLNANSLKVDSVDMKVATKFMEISQ